MWTCINSADERVEYIQRIDIILKLVVLLTLSLPRTLSLYFVCVFSDLRFRTHTHTGMFTTIFVNSRKVILV